MLYQKNNDMKSGKYYCYICGSELTEENQSDEHIILNAIGGHLHSYSILCKKCNNDLGEKADSRLAEDLSFYTDMLQVRKNRQNPHKQIMMDKDGHEVVVKDAGRHLELRKPSIEIQKNGEGTHINVTARNKKEVSGLLRKLINEGTIKQEDTDKILAKSDIKEHKPVLKKRTVISEGAFPSIIKSAVNYYMDCYHDLSTIKHLVPYIKGEKTTKDVLFLHHFKDLPYTTNSKEVTHMIHLEGHKETKLLYAMMEYFSIYIYVVILDSNYQGNEINKTYTYDVVNGKEIERNFSLRLTLKDLNDFQNLPHEEYLKYLPCIKNRADNVMKIWEQRNDSDAINSIINEVFGKYSDGTLITEEMINELSEKVSQYIIRKIGNSID